MPDFSQAPPSPVGPRLHPALEVFAVALRLGLISFGGPVAHLRTFRDEYVARRGWVDGESFAELVAVTSLLPGPSSSQLGMAIGTLRAGKAGMVAAWLGFTLPSALAMLALGLWVRRLDVAGAGWVHGLELATAAVVLSAVLVMGRSLAPDLPRLAIAATGAGVLVWVSGSAAQAAVILAGGVVGALAFERGALPELDVRFPFGRRLGACALVLFGALLVGLPLVGEATGSQGLAFVDAFYRAGSLVFGGGHVVLPLLHDAVVVPGWVSEEDFLAGYGAAQALPGPLIAFSAYLGAISGPEPDGVPGAALALAAIFLPSFLLLPGVLPAWASLRRRPRVQAALQGIGAATVGLLVAAFWDPILRTSVDGPPDVAFAAALFVLLRVLPAPAVVAAAAALGAVLF